MGRQRPANPALFVCDIQEKFRSAIYEFPKVISTAQKMMKACELLKIPVYITTQNAARLGSTVSELSSLSSVLTVDKTAFSMMVPEISTAISKQSSPLTVLLVGIETHICVTQTALDLLALGHKVYVLADGVSSCNAGERGIALARLAREGCTVTTSESVLFELVGDAGHKDFKGVAGLVKETKDETKKAVEVFCGAGAGSLGGEGPGSASRL